MRKIQIAWNTEAEFSAVSWDGSVVLNEGLVRELGLTPSQIRVHHPYKKDFLEKVRKFRGDKPPPEMRGRTFILVDDGLASGYPMATAVDSMRRHEPVRIIVAVPTGSRDAVQLVSSKTDLTRYLNIREAFCSRSRTPTKNGMILLMRR